MNGSHSIRRILIHWLPVLGLNLLLPSAYSQNNAGLAVQLYAGLSITGAIGSNYVIQYVTDLAETNNWQTLTNLALPSSPYLWFDASTPATSHRFYRAAFIPLTNMVLIPAGAFTMGDTFNEGATDEKPTHSVYVSAFLMDRYLVTKALWDNVRNWATNNNYGFDNAGSGKAASHPVQSMNWFDAAKWCNARSQKEGLTPCYYTDTIFTSIFKTGQSDPYVKWDASGYRLPTEAEWEKAARGGLSSLRFPWGNTINHSQANYISSASYAYDVSPTRGYHPTYSTGGNPYTSPPGSFAANSYGLYDMAGNVWQWCWDWYNVGENWYATLAATQSDTRGPATPNVARYRVLRGASWNNYALSLRCAGRYGDKEDIESSLLNSTYSLGFRCVKGL